MSAGENLFEAPRPITFPPLFSGQDLGDGMHDPFAHACARAALGCDAGLIVHAIGADMLRAAIVFAPEEALESALAVLPACGVGFQNALGALAPPEVAVHLTWDGTIRVNGGRCGRLRVAADTDEATQVPGWLVVGLELRLLPATEDDPGHTPDETALYLEGCSDVAPARLLEAWARHVLVWVNRLETGERAALHEQWRGLVEEIGHDIEQRIAGRPARGRFVGVDEHFNMLLRAGDETRALALAALLENDIGKDSRR